MKRYFGWVWFCLMCLWGLFLLVSLLYGVSGINSGIMVLIIVGLGFSAWKGGWEIAHPIKQKGKEE
jgi:hypothetical protein